MERNYYFLANTLPPLKFEELLEMRFREFWTLLEANLLPSDLKRARSIRLYYDLENLRAHWNKKSIDCRGNFNENELTEAIHSEEGFPEYVYSFLDKYEGPKQYLKHFPALLVHYFQSETETQQGFLKQFFQFERDWRLVFCGFRSKKVGRELSVELQYTDPADPLVAQMMAQKDAAIYEPPQGYEELKSLFESFGSDPLQLHQKLCQYRFSKLTEMTEMENFSLDRILSYMAKLILVEKWQELDQNQGAKILDQIVKERA